MPPSLKPSVFEPEPAKTGDVVEVSGATRVYRSRNAIGNACIARADVVTLKLIVLQLRQGIDPSERLTCKGYAHVRHTYQLLTAL